MISIIQTIFDSLFELLGGMIKVIFNTSSGRKTELNADFLPVIQLLSQWNKGFCLNGTKSLTVKQSYTSAMVLGGSGSGKSVSVCIPSIYNLAKHGHSLCIHDPAGEIYSGVAGYLATQGYTIKIIHFANPSISDGYNPMARAKSTSDIQKVATLLVRNALGENNKDPFWQTQSVMLISLMMRILQKQSPWFQTLANVKYLIDSMTVKPEALDILVVQCHDQLILNEWKQFLAMDKKLLTSIISTVRASLVLLTDPDVQKVTAFDSISFEKFRTEKVALFIANKGGDIAYYSALSSAFFEQFFSHIMERIPEKQDRSIFFIIDEASSLYLPSMQLALSNLRKFKAGIMNIAQDFNQFIHLYGNYTAEAIKSNSFAKVYFPGQPLNTCQELERFLGTFEFEDEKGNRRTRHLMTTDEIRAMEPNTSIIIAGSHRAVFTRMKPYFKNYKYKNLSKYPIPERTSQIPFEELPLIPLPYKLK
jgi:type IV secretion system protein VirD4